MTNNKSFLESVAQDIINRFGTELADVAVVFPNKRASLFLNKHLAQIAKSLFGALPTSLLATYFASILSLRWLTA